MLVQDEEEERKIKRVDGFCAPSALKYLSGLDEKLVYDICAANHWNEKIGMEDREWMKAFKEAGVKFRRLNLKRKGLYGKILRKIKHEYSAGRYIVLTDNHIFVLDNGEIIDPLYLSEGLSRKIVGLFKVMT